MEPPTVVLNHARESISPESLVGPRGILLGGARTVGEFEGRKRVFTYKQFSSYFGCVSRVR